MRAGLRMRAVSWVVLLGVASIPSLAAQPATESPAGTELRLWPGKAPGSERWSIPESVTTSASGDRVISNVSDPTLTVFLPAPEKANGTAVVIAPGGALRVLGMDNEGVKVARWLNERGIAAFVLKYRTLQQAAGARTPPPGMPAPPAMAPSASTTASGATRPASPPAAPAPAAPPRQEIVIRNANANPAPDDAALTEVLQFAVADAQAAMRLVGSRAASWRIDPARVGMMGFSAGGGVIIGAALAPRTEASPDFLISLYGPSLMDVKLNDQSPPLFIAVGATHFNVTSGCLALFSAWKDAGRPVELHVYDGVSAGFGLSARGAPVDGWIDRAYEWMVARRFTTR